MAIRKNTFLLKRSNVAGNVPAAGQILLGELALNTADCILYASGTTSNSILPIGWDRVYKTGDTITGDLIIEGDLTTPLLSATSINVLTISAETYQNLPNMGEVNTGLNVGSGSGQMFRNKTGVTLNFRTLQSSGNTLNVVTNGDIVNLDIVPSRISSSVQTTNATPTILEVIDTIPDNATSIIEVYVKAYSTSAARWGVWKRTLTVTKVGGTVTIREENADVDKASTGLRANSLTFSVSGGNINVNVTGIAATTINWNSKYEIIL